MKKKRTLLIIIIMIVVLAVAGTVFGYLFFETDIFKSDKELFAKYMNQNIEMFQKMTNLKTNEIYEGLKDEDKYESNTQISATYAEGGEISSPINELAAKIDIQKDEESDYFYADAQILFEDEEYLELETIKEQELYGVRFSDVVKQFITVKEDEQLETIANNIGIDIVQLQDIIAIIDGATSVNEQLISEEEAEALKNKYIGIISETISNGTFSSQKKAMITYNNVTTKTNSYTVMIKSEQVEEMLVNILTNLKNEEILLEYIENNEFIDETIKKLTDEIELPTIKISLFENDGRILRTVIEIEGHKIIIESLEENGQQKFQIQFSISDDDKITEYNIAAIKISDEQQEKVEITMETGEGEEEKQIITILNEMKLLKDEIDLNLSISYKKDIITTSLILNNSVSFGNGFDKKQTLEDTNNIILNKLEESRRVEIINLLKQKVPEKIKIRLDLLAKALGIKEDESNEAVLEGGMTQVEINKFNAKFEFYTGDAVSTENVEKLLEIVKDNLGYCEITPIEGEQDMENVDPEDIKYNIKLVVERNKTNQDAINQVLEKINDQKRYKVIISYKEQNGLIDYITISEVEE